MIRRFPVTFGLIGVTGIVFVLQYLTIFLIGFDLVIDLGAKYTQGILEGQVWRFVTPVFIHGGLLHFGVNMYSLFVIGRPVEAFFGHWRMLVIYLLSGIGGVLMSLALSPGTISVGASGAIFGLLGALGVFYFINRAAFGKAGAFQLRQIVFVALINLALGLNPGIDNWGHLGGLIVGAALTWFIGPVFSVGRDEITGQPIIRDERPWAQAWPAALVGGTALLVLAIALML
jgi:rhomboid protease GluP